MSKRKPRFRIERDEDNYILYEWRKAEKGKEAKWHREGFYSRLENLLTANGTALLRGSSYEVREHGDPPFDPLEYPVTRQLIEHIDGVKAELLGALATAIKSGALVLEASEAETNRTKAVKARHRKNAKLKAQRFKDMEQLVEIAKAALATGKPDSAARQAFYKALGKFEEQEGAEKKSA